jgi:DNA-binding LacI/PurR family transcriptional regulator
MPTVQDLADKLDLSPSLVSRVLSNPTNVRASEATRRRIHEAARAMGYQPNHVARSLRGGRAGVIGLWTPKLEGAYFGAYFHAMRDLANASGMQLYTHEVRDFDGTDTAHAIEWNWRVDGIVAFDCPESVRRHFANRPADRTPAVSVGPYYSEEIDHVGIDLYPASCDAMALLIGMGRTRICYLGRRYDHDGGRYRAYEEAMTKAGLAPYRLSVDNDTLADGYAAVSSTLAAGGADAIFAANDALALGALRALSSRGSRVPDEVAVVGCDGIEEGRYFTPSLTTIAIPAVEACRAAWDLLQSRISDPLVGVRAITFSASLARGESA